MVRIKPYSQEKFEAYRKYSDAERKAEGLSNYYWDRELWRSNIYIPTLGNNIVETVEEIHPPELETYEKNTIPQTSW